MTTFPWPEPRLHPDAWVASSAVVIGDVQLAAGASLWPTAVAMFVPSWLDLAAMCRTGRSCTGTRISP